MDALLKLLAIQSESRNCVRMYNYLLQIAWDNKWNPLKDKTGNLYMTKGQADTYPCVVAHMDTVHKITKGGIEPIVFKGNVFGLNPETMKQTGIGGDDKCGIWAALRLMEKLPACKALFFVDEEVGAIGSRHCDLDFFHNCRFVLCADRRGNDDFVTRINGPLGSDEFHEAVAPIIKDFGYKACNGMMTDVQILRDRKVGVSVANMSAGYFNPHFDSEYINLEDLDRVCLMMEEICREVTDTYPFVEPEWVAPPKVTPQLGYGHDFHHRYDDEVSGYYNDGEFPGWGGAGSNHGVVVGGSNNGDGERSTRAGVYYICNHCRQTCHESKVAVTHPVPVCVYCASDLLDKSTGDTTVKTREQKEASFWKRLREGKRRHRKRNKS